MLAVSFRKSMSRSAARAISQRTTAISQHMSSSSTSDFAEPSVKFESVSSLRTFILNRPKKLNALDDQMLSILRPKIEEWRTSELCSAIVARGVGRAFCCGGDVAKVIKDVANPTTLPQAINFFKREFEMDYILATLPKPYVVILDGLTMGGGVGLAANAPFRIATENTVFAMPETKIGYCPDVGGNYFLSRMDGELGTYLALTSDTLLGRAVFEHGFATHFVPARRIPMLLDQLAELHEPHPSLIDRTIENFAAERESTEPPAPFTGAKRIALDSAFCHNEVDHIVEDLEVFSQTSANASVKQWASDALQMLRMRSPTSLKVALTAIRRGKELTLLETLNMELKIATAYCSGASPDFITGVKAVIVDKTETRPLWSPAKLDDVSAEVVANFFEPNSPYLTLAPELTIPADLTSGTKSTKPDPVKYALPSEKNIGSVVIGSSRSTYGIQFEELLQMFIKQQPGKLGVKEKIYEVVQRRCELIDNADGNRVWLRWKPMPHRRRV